MAFPFYKYCLSNEAKVYKNLPVAGVRKIQIDSILLGSYIKVTGENGDWYQTEAFGKTGWMSKADLGDESALKVFYLDVGQGDGALIEINNLRILVDAGTGDNMYNYLTKYHFKYFLTRGDQVHIDYLVISHFDKDHYNGFTELINDRRFTFGEIIHPGILKFKVPDGSDEKFVSELGIREKFGSKYYLTKIFDDLSTLVEPVEFSSDFSPMFFNRECGPFITAVVKARAENRIGVSKRLKAGDVLLEQTFNNKTFRIDVLAPFTETIDERECFLFWTDGGKTVNGHSLVLKLTYGERTYLFGGDLNEKSQVYLMKKYGEENPFEVDVAKSCHHGSQDFSVDFMRIVNPYATIISSGDNEGHAHPRADAVGCSGRYSRSERPLVFSTELARSTNISTGKILYGMINSRCNGTDIYFSQMKEAKDAQDLWDSYKVDIQ